MKELEGKTAVITGAAGGLGLALAGVLLEEGMDVALLDWSDERLKETEAALANAARRVTTHRVDVRDPSTIEAARRQVEEAHGRTDLLVNAAGINLQKSFALHSPEDWAEVLDINLSGPAHMIRIFLPLLKEQSEAHILNISSMAGFIGLPTQSSYSASKAGLTALSESLRVELKGDGIGVTTVTPGAIRTPLMARTLERSENLGIAEQIAGNMTWFGLTPEKAARRMVRAVKRNRSHARITADAVLTDWTIRLAPHFLLWPLGIAYRKLLRL